MKPIESLREYVLEPNFSMTVLNGKIDIVNYLSIEHFDSNKVMIKCESVLIVIEGSNLVVSRLLKDEVLIIGKIKSIEFR